MSPGPFGACRCPRIRSASSSKWRATNGTYRKQASHRDDGVDQRLRFPDGLCLLRRRNQPMGYLGPNRLCRHHGLHAQSGEQSKGGDTVSAKQTELFIHPTLVTPASQLHLDGMEKTLDE